MKNNTTLSTNQYDSYSSNSSILDGLYILNKRIDLSEEEESEINLDLSFCQEKFSTEKNLTINNLYTLNFNKESYIKKNIENKKKSCKKCNCKKNNCLRLYCVCFKELGFCGKDCGCTGCFNNEKHLKARDFVIEKTKLISNYAFKNKTVILKNNEKISKRGCKCKKSCLKHYCECRRLNSKCSPICKCESCLNSKLMINKDEILKIYKPLYRKKHKINIDSHIFESKEILNKIEFKSFSKKKTN